MIEVINNPIRTWRLIMEFNTEELRPIAEKFAQAIQQGLQEQPDPSIRAIETGMRQWLQSLGQLTLGLVLSQAEAQAPRSLPCGCGGRLQYQRRREAQVLSVFGKVTYERSYYAGCDCGQGQAPLDERFGLAPGQVTAGLAALVALAGVELAFEHSGRWLEQFLLFTVSENTVRKETEYFGQLQAEQESRQKEISHDPACLQARLREAQPAPLRLYGSLDGAHVRIEERGRDPDMMPAAEKWREMKVGCWYTVAAVPRHWQRPRHRQKAAIGHQALQAQEMHYFCEIAEADHFAALLWATGLQAQADRTPEVVFVCDGAQWIWRLIDHYYPQAVQIVDWFHAEERLQNLARDVVDPETAPDWLESMRSALWQGDLPTVIRACEKLAPFSTTAAQAATYFRNNADRMQYDRFRAQGYMIGSGTVESGCKQIVTQRLKRSGAQWHVPGANQTAKARAAWLSGHWNDLCAQRDALPLVA
jgi:hypothetical protein